MTYLRSPYTFKGVVGKASRAVIFKLGSVEFYEVLQ